MKLKKGYFYNTWRIVNSSGVYIGTIKVDHKDNLLKIVTTTLDQLTLKDFQELGRVLEEKQKELTNELHKPT